MAEVKELFLNDPAYGSLTKVYEWINMSSCNSMYIIAFSDVDFTCTVDYAIDSAFDVVDTENTGGFGGSSTKLILYAKTRFMRLTVTLASQPAILRSQAFFHQESVIEKTIENGSSGDVQKVDPQLEKTGFGALHVEGYVPKQQFVFSKGVNGDVTAFQTYYEEILGYDSLTNAAVTFVDGKVKLSGFSAVEKAFLYSYPIRYSPGQAFMARFTGKFFQGAKDVGGKCTIQLTGVGNTDAGSIVNGIYFGYGDDSLTYDPDNFGIAYYRNGTKTFVPRSAWNVDRADGTFSTLNVTDWNKLNVFQVDFQYLGGGNMNFYIEDITAGSFVKVHTLRFAGSLETSSFTDPTAGMVYYQEITANSLPLTTTDAVESASFGIFLEGMRTLHVQRGGVYSPKTGVTVEELVVAVRCDTTHFGGTNFNSILIDMMTCSSEGQKPTSLCVWIGPPAIITTPTWTQPIARLPVSTDKLGTWNPGNGEELVFVVTLSKGGNEVINLQPYDIQIHPGTVFVVTALSSQASDVACGLTFTST